MAAVTTNGTEQDSTPANKQNGTLAKGENRNNKQGPADSKQEPGDNEDETEMDVSNGDGKEEKPSVAPEVAKESVLPTENGNKEDEPACELSEPVKSPVEGIPASSTETGESTVELNQEQEQREESVSSPPSSDKTKSEESTEKTDHGIKRRASVEISSSDGEPLSRMDSEDSISSTLMDMESTASSGRSTPAMMNGHGPGTATPSVGKGVAYTCCWDQCQLLFTTSPDLAEHIRGVHVDGQRGGVFVCLWKGCKVYNTPSTSQSWLQRHMVSHSGDKPFKCVVGGCNATFASQGGLARHVPTHFSSQNSNKLANQGKMKEDSPSKAGLNKRRKLKNKRRRSLPRPHDFFDAQTMDAIRHRAICLNLATHIESLGNGHSVVFHSTVIARRKEDSGKVKVLLHWTPEDILPDVWVNESDRPQQKTKVVHLSQLPQETHVLLDPNIYRMFF
ncbi:zinc finger protein AEBP2 isoform X2 [Oncorhynchus tshawytscha]|uniref:zinc finger protein AEBP2 isoform X2 n=1 Tax=Oncorhynchus tshawytscha TaxID=74940 RepID=UPI000D0A73C8|nr:zinc finger protein AEBP2 isoform X2 [Oncorhynchus tshawytscha]